jgi:hypothetical protein
LAQDGQNVLAEGAENPGGRAAFAGLDDLFVPFEPFMEHGFERIFDGQADGLPFPLAIRVRIGSPSEQSARFIPRLPRLSQGDFRVGVQGHAFLPAAPVVAKMPRFAALRENRQGQPVEVAQV